MVVFSVLSANVQKVLIKNLLRSANFEEVLSDFRGRFSEIFWVDRWEPPLPPQKQNQRVFWIGSSPIG